MPPMIVIDMGARVSLPGPSAIAAGSAAISIAAEVITIGLRRTGPACCIASSASKPPCSGIRSWLA